MGRGGAGDGTRVMALASALVMDAARPAASCPPHGMAAPWLAPRKTPRPAAVYKLHNPGRGRRGPGLRLRVTGPASPGLAAWPSSLASQSGLASHGAGNLLANGRPSDMGNPTSHQGATHHSVMLHGCVAVGRALQGQTRGVAELRFRVNRRAPSRPVGYLNNLNNLNSLPCLESEQHCKYSLLCPLL